MELSEQERIWTTLGVSDPLSAVLSDPRFKNGRWDVENFYRTGDREIDAVLSHLAEIGHRASRGVCLEFGCGPGRCSEALARWFGQYHGVDISEPMLAIARNRNDSDRFHYHHNTQDDLRIFGDESFDFVYSRLVLQHIPPPHSTRYIAELIRVLRPGGLAVLQVPSETRSLELGAHQARIQLDGPLPRLLRPGAEFVCLARVANLSKTIWPADGVWLGNHWRDGRGRLVRLDDGRATLPADLVGGAEAICELRMTTPSREGRYILEFDLVEEGVTWFAQRGSLTARLPVLVDAGARHRRRSLGRPSGLATRALLSLLRRLPRGGVWGRVRHLAQRLKSLSLEPSANPQGEHTPNHDAAPGPSRYKMYCIPKDEVLALVRAAGAEVLEVSENRDSGASWVSYLYTVRKPPPGPACDRAAG